MTHAKALAAVFRSWAPQTFASLLLTWRRQWELAAAAGSPSL